MNGPTCTTQTQCKLNGIFGTAVALGAACLAWVAFDGLGNGAALGPALRAVAGLWLLPLAPTFLSVLLWAGLRLTGRLPGWIATGFAGIGAAWGVIMLNVLEGL